MGRYTRYTLLEINQVMVCDLKRFPIILTP